MQEARMKEAVRSKRSIAVVVAIAAALLAGTATHAQHGNGGATIVQTAAGPDAASQVIISNYAFSPVPLTVKAGTTVTWVNHDSDPHSVDSTQGKFKSAALDTNGKFEFKFTEPGEYPFNCRFHPKMTGKVIVQP